MSTSYFIFKGSRCFFNVLFPRDFYVPWLGNNQNLFWRGSNFFFIPKIYPIALDSFSLDKEDHLEFNEERAG